MDDHRPLNAEEAHRAIAELDALRRSWDRSQLDAHLASLHHTTAELIAGAAGVLDLLAVATAAQDSCRTRLTTFSSAAAILHTLTNSDLGILVADPTLRHCIEWLKEERTELETSLDQINDVVGLLDAAVNLDAGPGPTAG